MSDGCRESEREPEKSPPQRKAGRDELAQAVAKIAVAQICEGEGFQTFQQSALETLGDVALRYICDIGKTAHLYANLAGRTECNVFDIIQGLEDLCSAQGFLGASDTEHCLAGSGTVRELAQFVGEAQQIPFAYSLPPFPVHKDRKLTPSFSQIGEEPPGEHIPNWLPAFPDPGACAQSSPTIEKMAEPASAKIELKNQRRRAERSLLNLHQRLACNGLEGPSSVNRFDAAKAKQAIGTNPFLAVPLQFGEKEVSPVVLPTKAKFLNEAAGRNSFVESHGKDNHVSVLEALAPDIEEMETRMRDFKEGHKKVILNSRPTVQFKIGVRRKSFGTMLELSPQDKRFEATVPWSGMEKEKDDKKQRAEKILKESMANTQEMDHL